MCIVYFETYPQNQTATITRFIPRRMIKLTHDISIKSISTNKSFLLQAHTHNIIWPIHSTAQHFVNLNEQLRILSVCSPIHYIHVYHLHFVCENILLTYISLEKTKSSLWLIQRSFCLTKDLFIHIISGSPSDECSKGLWDL